MTLIHPTALVDPAAQLDSSVRVGPYATLGQAQADAVKLKLAGLAGEVRKR